MKRGWVIALVVALLLFFVGGFLYRNRFILTSMAMKSEMPSLLKSAQIVSGKDQVSKQLMYSNPTLGTISDLKRLPNGNLVVVGQRGAAFISQDQAPPRTVVFDDCRSEVTYWDFADGRFLCRGSWINPTILLSNDGKKLWTYTGEDQGIDDSVAGELGTNATKGVVVGFNGGGGVRFLSPEGKEIWKQEDGNVWQVAIVSGDAKSGNTIVHSNARGELKIRDKTGALLSRNSPEPYLSHFSLTAWGDDPQVNKLLVVDKDFIYVLSMDGKTLARLQASTTPSDFAEVIGTPARLAPVEHDYAALVHYSYWKRAILFMYDEQNRVIYQEVLGHDCAALNLVPSKSGSEDLLVGCDGEVWKYSRGQK